MAQNSKASKKLGKKNISFQQKKMSISLILGKFIPEEEEKYD